jgi:hypothetical protein
MGGRGMSRTRRSGDGIVSVSRMCYDAYVAKSKKMPQSTLGAILGLRPSVRGAVLLLATQRVEDLVQVTEILLHALEWKRLERSKSGT